jgi:type II secretory pathway component PulM
MFDFGIEWYHIFLLGMALGLVIVIVYLLFLQPVFNTTVFQVNIFRPENPFLR